jgi:hypothetical protein
MTETPAAGKRGPKKGAKYDKMHLVVCQAPKCPRNGEPFEATASAAYCSPRCQVAASRARRKAAAGA